MKPIRVMLISCVVLFLLIPTLSYSQTPLKAFDIPSDDGKAIGLSWNVSSSDSPDAEYAIYRAFTPNGSFEEIERFASPTHLKSDAPKYFGFSDKLKKEHFIKIEVEFEEGKQIQHYYKVMFESSDDTYQVGSIVTAIAKPNWFARNKINNLILMLVLCGSVLFFIEWAKRNPNLFIRKLAGLEALDEAVGRATEMGKPIMYTTGYHDMDRVSTIASVNILEHVAKKVAEYDTRMIIPCKWSVAMTVCQEVVKEAYTNAGRPDSYNANDIYYVAGEQFSLDCGSRWNHRPGETRCEFSIRNFRCRGLDSGGDRSLNRSDSNFRNGLPLSNSIFCCLVRLLPDWRRALCSQCLLIERASTLGFLERSGYRKDGVDPGIDPG